MLKSPRQNAAGTCDPQCCQMMMYHNSVHCPGQGGVTYLYQRVELQHQTYLTTSVSLVLTKKGNNLHISKRLVSKTRGRSLPIYAQFHQQGEVESNIFILLCQFQQREKVTYLSQKKDNKGKQLTNLNKPFQQGREVTYLSQ